MAQRKKKRADRSMWKMSPERLEEHLKLRSRATRIPDKKKEQSRKACRNTRQAFGLSGVQKIVADFNYERWKLKLEVMAAGE